MSDANFSSRRENVKVVIRFRPTNKVEKVHEKEVDEAQVEPMTFDEQNGNIVLGKKQNKIWGFDGVCAPSTTQEEIFHVVAEQTCRDVVNGYNGTIFVYGQTGSGKTYTMYGAEDKPDAEQFMGLIPRCVAYIFDHIENDADIETFRVTCSFLEIYQERPRDLLNKAKHQDLKIRLNKRHETYMQGLVEHPVESLTEVLQLIAIAVQNRVTDSTDMNAVSSRGHMLMKMTVVIKLKDSTIKIATANFADLAGSEKVKKSGAKGQRLEEAKAINKSLSVLGQVIHALSSGKGKHVPFRDSILTHILRDSLGGNCKTTLVVSVSPHRYNRSESINSLRFGRRCKLVTNKASVNRVFSNEELMKKLAVLEAKNDELQQMLKQRAFEAFTNSELPKQIETLQRELSAVKHKLAVVSAENENLDAMLKSLRFEKSELEDGAASDRDKLDAYAAQIDDYEVLVERLRTEVATQQQKHELLGGQHALLSQKVTTMELDQQSRAQQMQTLQLELHTLRQYKHDAQQQNIAAMRAQQDTQDETTALRRQVEQQRMAHEQQAAVHTKALTLAQTELADLHEAQTELAISHEISTTKQKLESEQLQQQKAFQEQVENQVRAELRVELRQQLTLELRAEMESELNTKLSSAREQFTTQLTELQQTMSEMHSTQNTMRSELDASQTRGQQLQSRDEQNTSKLLAMDNEKESLLRELDRAKKQVAEEQQRLAATSTSAEESGRAHAAQIETYEEHRERLLQEKETLSMQLDETRQALDEHREDFKRREDMLSGRIEEQDNLIKRAQREHAKSRAKQAEQSEVVQASNVFIQRQHHAIKHRESKISVLKQEKRGLQKSNQFYKDIQERIDEDIAKKLQEEEDEAPRRRRVQLEAQRLKDEAYLRTMLLQEHSKNGSGSSGAAAGGAAAALVAKKRNSKENQDMNALNAKEPSVSPSPSRASMSKTSMKSAASRASMAPADNAEDESMSMAMPQPPPASAAHTEQDVTRLMQRSNEMASKNLSQLIGQVAIKQQQDRLLKQKGGGGKQAMKKSVLDLWIKAQMQLMCGQLPTICKKYGIQLRKLNDMYDGAKRSYQPQIDEFHYLKFRDDNWDPREYDQLRSKEQQNSPAPNGGGNGNGGGASTPNQNAANHDMMDPYNFYNGGGGGGDDDEDGDDGQRIEMKPQGFVNQPHSPVSPSQAAMAMPIPELDINQSEPQKRKSKFGFLKRKDKKKRKSKKNADLGQSDPSAMQYEQEAAPPMPFGQYLNDHDLNQFERVGVPPPQSPDDHHDDDEKKELFTVSPSQSQSPSPAHLQAQPPPPPLQSTQKKYIQKKTQLPNIPPPQQQQQQQSNHNVSNSNMSAYSNGTVVRHAPAPPAQRMASLGQGHAVEPEYSRDFSISVINMSVMNDDAAPFSMRMPSIPMMQPQQQHIQPHLPPSQVPRQHMIFEAMTQLKPIGEMAGVRVNAEFGLLSNSNRPNSAPTPVLRVQLVNNNINGAMVSRLSVRFQRNHVGLNTTASAIPLTQSIAAPNGTHRFNVALALNAHECASYDDDDGDNAFSFVVPLIVETNVFAIQCHVETPVHIFFESKGYLPRDQFLTRWRSINAATEAKVQIGKARSTDIEQLKTLLTIHRLFYIHHRPIPNKGDILYYSCKMHGEALLTEISVAVSGKGTIVVRSNDRHKSVLCVHAVQGIIDQKH